MNTWKTGGSDKDGHYIHNVYIIDLAALVAARSMMKTASALKIIQYRPRAGIRTIERKLGLHTPGVTW
ncbi:MAG: hypothetical protein ABI155_14615, partial [Paralcaligenes sp.]